MGFASWDERELVRRCKEGSEAAYAELVRRHRPRLLGLAFRLTGSRETAEDVVQEAFIAAFRAMERFEPRPAVAPWLNTITVRLAGRAASRRAARPDTSLDRMLAPDFGPGVGAGSDGPGGSSGRAAFAGDLLALADHSADPLAAAEAAEVRRELGTALESLPFRHRAAVVLRFVMGLEYAEAAQTLDIPLNTYKSHLLRGTRQLRDALGPRLAAIAGTPPSVATPPTDAEPIDGELVEVAPTLLPMTEFAMAGLPTAPRATAELPTAELPTAELPTAGLPPADTSLTDAASIERSPTERSLTDRSPTERSLTDPVPSDVSAPDPAHPTSRTPASLDRVAPSTPLLSDRRGST